MSDFALVVRDLSIVGDSERLLLSLDVLTVSPGETIGIRGPSGAGKSTLLFALAGLVKVKSGSVHWGDCNFASLNEEARSRFRRHHIGMIFQDFLLFEELDALSNAAIATGYIRSISQNDLRKNAADVLEKLKVRDIANRTIASFSGGERQRVAIARALAHDPAIILADEPTASLDRVAADALIDDLVALVRAENKTLIAVSHDGHLHEKMDRVIEIVDGQMVREVSNA
ncbi:ATP-binding cassette domain-containing protein [uncultured Cohaesibacter sp.]|uniref:ABC transporter ATP-binding protein n=1 Tax=uncultured Cohaesibacter sp. TaxID=1002546 RepID=UPI0029311374|nr:ATP-binding cassette domain-containing protein [uncultured Cohaesibacter sp.]